MIDLKGKHLILAVLALFVIEGCGYTRLAGSSDNRPSHVPYYPANLAIVYFANDAEFNSFDGYIIKDIGTRSVRTTFILSESEKIRIYQALKDMDMSNYEGSVGSGGFYGRSLRVRYENVLKDLSWTTIQTSNDDKSKRLKNLQQVLDDVLFKNPYYLLLPPYEGPPRL